MAKLFYAGRGKTLEWPDIPNAMGMTFDDVLLKPQHSTLVSRSQANLSTTVGPFQLKIPLISAPMDTISGEEMIIKLHTLGALGSLPRGDIQKRLTIAKNFSNKKINCLYCIGLKDTLSEIPNPLEVAKAFENAGVQMILIDIANGYLDTILKLIKNIKTKTKLSVMAGNIADYCEAQIYANEGVDAIRVGIGPGGACSTRIQTGTGVAQLSAILDTVEVGIPIIADGGLRSPGDIAKALAAGASAVMIGSLIAGTDETPGAVIQGRKIFRGQASKEYMQDYGVIQAAYRTAEGITTTVPAKGPVQGVLNQIIGGVSSAMLYQGAKNLKDFYKKSVFTQISDATTIENTPHVNRDQG